MDDVYWWMDTTLDIGWWFGTWLFSFPYIGNNQPNWLIFFGGVRTTNQWLDGKKWKNEWMSWDCGFTARYIYGNLWGICFLKALFLGTCLDTHRGLPRRWLRACGISAVNWSQTVFSAATSLASLIDGYWYRLYMIVCTVYIIYRYMIYDIHCMYIIGLYVIYTHHIHLVYWCK